MVLLTVASSHPAIVVGDGDEVIATGPGVGVNQELGHVQVSARSTSHQFLGFEICSVVLGRATAKTCSFVCT